MTARACLLGLGLALTACSSSPATPDVRPADLALAERGSDLRQDRGKDHAPDGPRPPASWKTIPGPGLTLEDHTVTLLANGDVLIAGGSVDDGKGNVTYLSKAYRYLPASDTIVDAGTLAQPRSDHSAVLLADGRVLVFGGERASSSFLTDTELFDPAKPAASAWSAGPSLPEPRRGASGLLLPDGQLMLSGGDLDDKDAVDTILFLQPASATWKLALAPLKAKRRFHASTLLSGGKVLLSGGSRGPGKVPVYLTSLEAYDPKSGSSTLLSAAMSRPRTFHSATLVGDGRVLLVGGYCGSCSESFDDLYDPKTDTVAPLTHPGRYPWGHVAAKLHDGRVLVAAHEVDSGLVVAFNASSTPPGWEVLPSLPHPRWRAEGVLLKDGSVLVVGGVGSLTPFAYAPEIERFFP